MAGVKFYLYTHSYRKLLNLCSDTTDYTYIVVARPLAHLFYAYLVLEFYLLLYYFPRLFFYAFFSRVPSCIMYGVLCCVHTYMWYVF